VAASDREHQPLSSGLCFDEAYSRVFKRTHIVLVASAENTVAFRKVRQEDIHRDKLCLEMDNGESGRSVAKEEKSINVSIASLRSRGFRRQWKLKFERDLEASSIVTGLS